MWALVHAAGASPGVRHRWTSVQHLVAHAAASDRASGKRVGPNQLEQLLADCVDNEPMLSMFEDFVPEDPRDVVHLRLEQSVVRLFPGQIERPVADVNRALLVSSAVDDLLIASRGFGIFDVLEVVLGYVDTAIGILAPSWPSGELATDGAVALTEFEMEAGRQLLNAGTPAHLQETERQRLALEWLTCDSVDLPYRPSHPQSPFGRFVRIRRPGGELNWLPLAFLPEILGCAVVELAHDAAALPGAQDRFATAVAGEVQRLLWKFASLIYGPVDESGEPIVRRHNGVQWVPMVTPQRAILVQVVSSLRIADLPLYTVPEALRAARTEDGALEVDMAVGQLTLVEGTEAVPLLIAASPGHIAAPQGPGLPAMSLDDLLWANCSADARLDLFTYCRDMSRDDLPPFFGLEAINLWEWWRSNGKSFFSGGQPPSMMLVAPHAGIAEWHQAARWSPLEVALFRLQLPAMRQLAGIDDRGTGPHSIYMYVPSIDEGEGASGSVRAVHRLPGLIGWTVHASAVPVAVSAAHTGWADDAADLLRVLSIAMCTALAAIDHQWTSAHEGSNICSYVVEVVPRTTNDGPALEWTDHERFDASAGSAIRAQLAVDCQALVMVADTSIDDARDALAVIMRDLLLAAGIGVDAAGSVETAWQSTAPTFGARAVRQPTVRNDLPSPIGLDDALVSSLRRRVAEAIHAIGVAPGEYKGQPAKELDRDVLAPAALTELNQVLAVHGMDDLVRFGMRQIERTINQKDRDLQALAQAISLLSVGADPLERYRTTEAQYLALRRSCETAVEAALRLAPTGTVAVDDIAWGEILAAAHSYLQATNRSEGIHHQLSPTLLRIDDSWEVFAERDESGAVSGAAAGEGVIYQLDVDAYTRAVTGERVVDEGSQGRHAAASYTPPNDASADTATEVTAESDSQHETARGPDGQRADVPVDPNLDEAMLEAYGAFGSDLVETLVALAAWPLAEGDDDAVVVGQDTVIQHVLSTARYGNESTSSERAQAALAMLASTASDLAAQDWKPWHARSRKRRLLVQPIPALSDGKLVVAPHFCFGAASMYLRYLQQGQLPWSQPQPPRAVDQALAEVRTLRNRALERRVGAALRDEGWSVIEGVKETKPGRLNLPTLRSEIDAVVGRSDQKVIWLLEVKDPVDAVVTPEIRRALDRFFVDGKHPCYVTQLKVKYEDVAPCATNVAQALGLPDRSEDDPYEVRPLFVTRIPVPAAFVPGPFPFTTTAGLVGKLLATD